MEQNNEKNQFNDDAELVRFLKGQPAGEPAPAPEPAPTPEPTQPLTPEPVVITDELFNQYLSEKTGGKFGKLEDIQFAEIPDEAKDIYEILKENKTDELYEYLRKSKEDYSKWTRSAKFSVKKNKPPLKPTNLEPDGGKYVPYDEPLRLSWNYNGSNAQQAFKIIYRLMVDIS